MNWKRGFLRAWLLMTGLWLVLIVGFYIYLEMQIYWQFSEAVAVGEVPTAFPDRKDAPPMAIYEIEGKRYKIPADIQGEKLMEILNKISSETPASIKKRLKIFALTAFLPPAILFVIGAGGLWVFRGFRRGDA